MGEKRGRSVTSVQVEHAHGRAEEYTTQEAVQLAIFWEIHQKRFFLAEEAPICQGSIRSDLGYLTRTDVAEEILRGTYPYPPDFNEATRDLC